jgi:GNAT superfamily N-acetyltransferase
VDPEQEADRVIDDDVIQRLDPWRLTAHILKKPKGKPAPPNRFGEPTDVPFDDLEHLLLIWGEPLGNEPASGINVRGCIIDAAGCPQAVQEFQGNLNGGRHDKISLSKGMLHVNYRWLRRGIAYLALARLVEWAKRYHGDKKVADFNIGSYTDEKQDYLRRLYGAFGFRWADKKMSENQQIWKSNPILVVDLKLQDIPDFKTAGLTANAISAYVKDLSASLSAKKAALRVAEQKNESRKLTMRERWSGEKEDNSSSKEDPEDL